LHRLAAAAQIVPFSTGKRYRGSSIRPKKSLKNRQILPKLGLMAK
jgi:hypothetical protein